MIWIIGCKGMLGRELSRLLESTDAAYIGTDIETDITDENTLIEFINGIESPVEWIINCSAYTAVDKAEDEQEKAFLINSSGARNAASIARKIGANIVHISTDYVFDGTSDKPYCEDDPVSPLGIYGESKEEGERHVRALLDNHYIIRTSWLYGRYGSNFVTTMLRLFKEKDELGIVDDQHGSPTWTHDLAKTIYNILIKECNFGTYHFSNIGETTWYGFAQEIYNQSRRLGLTDARCKISAISTSAYPTRAKRPVYSVLSKDKIQQKMRIVIPRWENSLLNFLNSIKSQ